MQETVHLAARIHCVWGDEQVEIPAGLGLCTWPPICMLFIQCVQPRKRLCHEIRNEKTQLEEEPVRAHEGIGRLRGAQSVRPIQIIG